MKIKKIKDSHDEGFREAARLPLLLYGKDEPYVREHYTKVCREWDTTINPFFRYGDAVIFAAYENGNLVGRLAAYRNPRLDTDTMRIGTVGFVELINDQGVFDALFHEACEWLIEKNCTNVIGPMNGSFWNTYRFRLSHFDGPPHLGDHYTRDYYPDLFRNRGFQLLRTWYTRAVDLTDENNLEKIRQKRIKYARRLERMRSMGYSVSFFENDKKQAFQDIYRIANNAFIKHMFFQPVDHDEFMFLYDDLFFLLNRQRILFLNKDGKRTGFMVHAYDYGRALVNMRGRDSLSARLRFALSPDRRTLVHLFSAMEPENITNMSGAASGTFTLSLEKFYLSGRFDTILHPMMYENSPSSLYSEGISDVIATYGLFERSL